MANRAMIARLADFREFDELRLAFEERKSLEVQKLGEKTFASPENHDRLEWERLKAFYAGVEAVFAETTKARKELKREESQ